jgi:hypothetical protein
MSLRVDLTGNASGFAQMFKSAEAQAKAFNRTITQQVGSSWGGIGKSLAAGIAGAFTMQGVQSFITGVIDTGEQIKQMSEQMNMGADDVQKWSKAVDKAGLTLGGFQAIVAKFQELKETAKQGSGEGVLAREKLNKLGVSNEAILTDGGFSGQQIADLLKNANGGTQQRARLADVVGNRGLKYGAAADKFAGAQVDWDAHDREVMDSAKEAERGFTRWKTQRSVGAFKLVTDLDFAKTSLKERGKQLGWFFTGMNYGPFREGGMFNQGDNTQTAAAPSAEAIAEGRHAAITKRYGRQQAAAADKKAADDDKASRDAAMQSYLKAQQLDFDSQKQSAQLALHRSQEGNMTISDRRAMIGADRDKIAAEVKQREAAVKAGKLYGYTDAEDQKDKDLSPSEHLKKLQKQELELYAKQGQESSLTNELKQKPLDFKENTMSKVGLYSASDVAFNPLLGVAQRQLHALEKIASNTAPKKAGKDPHAP